MIPVLHGREGGGGTLIDNIHDAIIYTFTHFVAIYAYFYMILGGVGRNYSTTTLGEGGNKTTKLHRERGQPRPAKFIT